MDAFVRGARALLPMESYVCVSQVRRYVYVTLEEFLARMANSGVSKEEAEELWQNMETQEVVLEDGTVRKAIREE